MNVLLVTTGINPASGGPTHPVKGLCRALDRAGVNVTLLVLNGRHPFEDRGKVQVLRGARINVADYDLVHLQGLWHWGLHNVAVACRKYHVPYVVSSRGMLDPWALGVKRWKILEQLKRLGSWRPKEPIGCAWMRMWGYFVAPSDGAAPRQTGIKPGRAVRVLWVGRLLAWKDFPLSLPSSATGRSVARWSDWEDAFSRVIRRLLPFAIPCRLAKFAR
mgnify:CR=1 FL=1